MRQNRVLFVVFLFLVSLATCLLAGEVPLWVETSSSHRTGQAYPLPTANAPTYGYLTVATPTLTVETSTAVVVGTMPSNTHLIEIYAYNGDLNYGPSTVAEGATYHYIASGSSKEFAVATLTPSIYLIGRSATAGARITAR